MISAKIRNGFLAGILIGIGRISNVVSNNAILGSFLFSLALLGICILQLKLCTGVFGYIKNFKNAKDGFTILLSNIVGIFFFCYVVANFSSIEVDTSTIVNTKLNEVWYDALIRGVGRGILIYLVVECFKRHSIDF